MKISSAILIKKKCHRHQWFLAFKCERKKESEVAQSCATLCDPMDRNLPGSSVYGIIQARVLEWGATAFSRGSSRLRDQTQVSCIAGRCFTIWANRETTIYTRQCPKALHIAQFTHSNPRRQVPVLFLSYRWEKREVTELVQGLRAI